MLEEAIVALVTNGKVSVEDLAELGVAPAPVTVPKGKITTTAELRSTGTMGSWEPLDQVIIVTIIEHVGAVDKFQLSKGVQGPLRAPARARVDEPRRRRDEGPHGAGPAAPAVVDPDARLERLRLDEPSRDSKFSATDWVAFLKQLECQDNLKRLDLASRSSAPAPRRSRPSSASPRGSKPSKSTSSRASASTTRSSC